MVCLTANGRRHFLRPKPPTIFIIISYRFGHLVIAVSEWGCWGGSALNCVRSPPVSTPAETAVIKASFRPAAAPVTQVTRAHSSCLPAEEIWGERGWLSCAPVSHGRRHVKIENVLHTAGASTAGAVAKALTVIVSTPLGNHPL